jgi:hypothetical protein
MALTTAQLQTLKSAILAETDTTFVGYRTAGSTGLMADWLNGDSAFYVWRTATPASTVSNAVTWANFTPLDSPDGSATWQTRALACQGKQFNLQNMLLAAQGAIASGLANVRAGWQDATTNIPSGAAGALLSGGWATIRDSFKRAATRGEKIFATGTGTFATPGDLVWEGRVAEYDVVQATTQI